MKFTTIVTASLKNLANLMIGATVNVDVMIVVAKMKMSAHVRKKSMLWKLR
jgi:hypothetical protein